MHVPALLAQTQRTFAFLIIHHFQHWVEMSATCLALSVTISFAVWMMSPTPADTSDRCATSDQKAAKHERVPAGKQLPSRSKDVAKPSSKQAAVRAASPAPEKPSRPGAPLPGAAFNARSRLQARLLFPSLNPPSLDLTRQAALLLRLHRVQPQVLPRMLAPRAARRAGRGRRRRR